MESSPVLHVLLVVTSLLAACTQATDNNDAATATCCWPLQFQARLGRQAGTPTGGSPGIYEEEMLFSYDMAFKRWGFWIREKYVTSDYVELIYVEDYKTGKATVANPDGCFRMPLPAGLRMRLPCLPDNAKYIETGWIGNHTLPYDVWQWEVDEEDFECRGDHVPATIRMEISHDYCKPISEISWWTAQAFNYTANIGFLTLHYGETDGVNDEPFEDLRRFYDCKDVDQLPKGVDIRWDVHPDQVHLINRVRAPASSPDAPPTIG